MKDSKVLSGSGGGGEEERSWYRSMKRREYTTKQKKKNHQWKVTSQDPFLVLYNFSNFSMLIHNNPPKILSEQWFGASRTQLS